jgi:hypothetical protein
MRKAALIIIVALAFLAASSSSCKKSSTSPTLQSPTGTWLATGAEYVSVANPSQRVNIVSQGASVSLVLDASTFTFKISYPGQEPTVTTGSWSYTSDTMTLAPSGTSFTWVFNMSLSGDSMTLSGAHVQFNFSGTLEEATLNLVLARVTPF